MTNRIEWLDIAKGIAIILMVLGHTSIPQPLSNFIWAFHMPLFFIASGIATDFCKKGFCAFTLHRLRTLMLPFMIYSIIVLGLYQITAEPRSITSWLQQGWLAYALWFIPVLFFASILARIAYLVRNIYVRWCVLWCILSCGYMLSYNNIYLLWTLSSVPYACFLLAVGSESRAFVRVLDNNGWKHMVLGVGLMVLTAVISHFWRLDLCVNKVTPILPLTIGALAGSMMVFVFSSYLSRYTRYVSRLLAAIGRETYVIVAFSQIIILLINSHYQMSSILKYAILIITLYVLVLMKNMVNKVLNTRIL